MHAAAATAPGYHPAWSLPASVRSWHEEPVISAGTASIQLLPKYRFHRLKFFDFLPHAEKGTELPCLLKTAV